MVRPDHYGDPATAFAPELVDTPTLGPDEVLIAVMASGINYNNVWAARGYAVDQAAVRQKRSEPYDFHIGGSEASGIVYAIGADVETSSSPTRSSSARVYWNAEDPWILEGCDPMIAPTTWIWGYDTNFSSLGQFALPKRPGAAKGRAADLGAGGRSHADRHHGLPHDARLGRQHRPGATSYSSGAAQAAWEPGHPDGRLRPCSGGRFDRFDLASARAVRRWEEARKPLGDEAGSTIRRRVDVVRAAGQERW